MTDNAPISPVKAYVERIERLTADKRQADADIAEVYKEAKANGYNAAILRKLVAERDRDPAQAQEEDALLALYREGAK